MYQLANEFTTQTLYYAFPCCFQTSHVFVEIGKSGVRQLQATVCLASLVCTLVCVRVCICIRPQGH